MRAKILLTLATAAFVPFAGMIIRGVVSRRSAEAMAGAANAFLAALTPEQRAKATYEFGDEQRLDWHFVPRPRKGVSIKELDARQRSLAHDFLKTGLSQRGYLKATTIIALETVLRELEAGRGPVRDPELYFFTVFGRPSAGAPWGWRVEGHHLSLNFTVVAGRMVATTPAFMGANPAEVRQEGTLKGTRALASEEDIARSLLHSLDERQRAEAVFDQKALPDIVSFNSKQADPLAPVGIAARRLNEGQMKILVRLLEEYASSMAPDLAAERLARLRAAGLEKIHFGWAGGVERGQPHYYRVQGPTFLIEYDNTQNNANHVHTVWRDFKGDFGRDLLREHYRDTPHTR